MRRENGAHDEARRAANDEYGAAMEAFASVRLRTFAPDRTPVVGFDAVMDGFFWLAGQGGYGIQTAPALSRLAGALLRGEDGSAVLPANVVAALAPGRLRGAA